MKYEIRVPTYIMLGESKFRLNLNSYRNWNYHVSNAIKVKFWEEVEDKIPEKINGPVNITYQLFEKAKNRKDKGNILSIVQKFILDAITLKKAWTDDNDKVVKTETFLPTVPDPEKIGFVLVTITEIDSED